MSMKPDFAAMTSAQLRTYVLAHRDDQEALHAFLDKRHAENPNPKWYGPEDNIADAIDEYLQQRRSA